MGFNFSITSGKLLSDLSRSFNLFTWQEVVEYVKLLPYGRNSNRRDFSLVLKEGKGSCSSKHAFLKALAIENLKDEVELILAIYKMNAENTNIGKTISNYDLAFIPEAHCYLKISGKRIDITATDSSFNKIKKDIISEQNILPNQVAEYKVNYHQDFIKEWILEEQINLTFEEIWKIREACIFHLSKLNK